MAASRPVVCRRRSCGLHVVSGLQPAGRLCQWPVRVRPGLDVKHLRRVRICVRVWTLQRACLESLSQGLGLLRDGTCGRLDIVPGSVHLGYHNMSSGVGASWGGNAVYSGGLWHAFVAQMWDNCTLNSYGSNSGIVRVTSPNAGGPFTYADVVIQPFAHNPTVRELPGGEGYVLFMIGGSPSTPTNCVGDDGGAGRATSGPVSADPNAGSISVSWSATVYGPWSQPVFLEVRVAGVVCPCKCRS